MGYMASQLHERALRFLPKWFLAWGPWWSVYWSFDHTFSLGVHIEPRKRPRGCEPFSYGPYIDIHLPMLCVSLGNNPVYAGSLDAQRQFSRGNIPSE